MSRASPMTNFRDNQRRLTRGPGRGKTIAVNTICPKIGAAQWTCSREECDCHRKLYAHTEACAYRSGGWTALGQCNCGALR